MAKKIQSCVGLDIGTTQVTVAIAELSERGGASLIGVGTAPSHGIRKGLVINIEATTQSISQAIRQAETMAGVEVEHVMAAISGAHVKGFSSHGIVGIKNREVTKGDVERVIEAARAVAVPVDREILHVLPQQFIVDGQDGIKEPVGISGVRLESRVYIITGAVASAQNVVKCSNRCGLMVDDIILAPLATAKAVLTAEEQEIGVCLVDIGGGTSDLIVFHGGSVQHTAVLPIGGNHITNDIASGLRTPLTSAEDIKCRYGSALATPSSSSASPLSTGFGTSSGSTTLGIEEEMIEVPSTGERPARLLSKGVLAEVIEPRVHEMLSVIKKELARSGCEELLAGGIVLTGGTAKLQGLNAIAEQVLNVPVRTGSPRGVAGLSELVASPEYATAVGLVLYAAERLGKPLESEHAGSSPLKILKRVGSWFSEHF